jgi:hypothetical protein
MLSDVGNESRINLRELQGELSELKRGRMPLTFLAEPREFVETLFTIMSVTTGVDEAETGPLWGRASRGTHSQESGDYIGGVGHRPPGKKGADGVRGAINPAKIVAGHNPRSVDVRKLIRLHVSIVYAFCKRVGMYSLVTMKW